MVTRGQKKKNRRGSGTSYNAPSGSPFLGRRRRKRAESRTLGGAGQLSGWKSESGVWSKFGEARWRAEGERGERTDGRVESRPGKMAI